jgi:CheY-like chemotaxis protein
MAKTLLFIDDDVDDHLFFEMALKEADANFNLVNAYDGLDALEKLDSHQVLPDIIFLDNNMPRMNGLECLIQLKKRNVFSAIPVIIYSTSSSPEFIEQCKAEGAVGYLSKPDDFDGLVRALQKYLH